MKQEEVLIIGAKGQLGKALQDRYPGAKAVDSDSLDITNLDAVNAYDWANVKFILNPAAYTNVDGAETDEGRQAAWKVNAIGASYLSKVAQKNDITLVHISTDYVFDGSNDNHTENESFSPLSVYGSSKAAGDIAVSLCPKFYILRTSWVIGDGKNFVRTMLELGAKGVNPKVVSDQLGRLTFTTELVRAIDYLLSKSSPYGTYNVTNSGQIVSWADITRKIFEIAKYDSKVTDITTSEYYEGKTGIAPRPKRSTLDLSKLSGLGYEFVDWEEELKEYVNKELGI